MKNYTTNNYDCVGFILERLGIDFKPKALPLNWWQRENLLIRAIPEFLKEAKIKVKSIIFNQAKLEPGDILFMQFRGTKYIHHMAIYYKDSHVLHNMPGKGVQIDLLRKNSSTFRFGVRLWR